MRKTKVIATIGPATKDKKQLKALAKAGVNIFRLNFSHGDYAWYESLFHDIHELNKTLPEPIAIMADTKGPEIRTADVSEPITIKRGKTLTLTIEPGRYEETGKLGVSYPQFVQDVRKGERIFVDNGIMELEVQKISKKDVVCKILTDGVITSRRHLNLPGKEVSLDSITKKDWDDIAFAIKHGADYIALSFVRTAKDVLELQTYLKKKKREDIGVIAKIESFEATKHLQSIIEASDGVMVARGDLGAEVPFAQVPQYQQDIIDLGAYTRTPVIVATQMLESMISHPMPTRAEVTDVAHAVYQETDSIMLSGETAAGKYPIRTVETMVEIATVNEAHIAHFRIRDLEIAEDRELFAKLAASIPEDRDDIGGIVIITRRGRTAQTIANFRPRVPLFAFVPDARVAAKNQLYWGLQSLIIDFSTDPEKTLQNAKKALHKRFPKSKGKAYIILSDDLVDKAMIPMLQIRKW